jgi:predicted alpha/beta-fold hydrolase
LQGACLSYLTSLIQKAFFKNMKTEPNSRWVKRAESQGGYAKFHVHRQGKKIACYSLSPKQNFSADENSPIVIFSHPISRKAKFFFSDTERSLAYLNKGWTVFAFDYNGFGESEVIDLYYWQDVVAVLNYLKAQFPNRKMVLHGASFGAFHIIRAMEHLPQNSSVILENVNKSLLSYWQRWPLTSFLVKILLLARVRPVLDMNVRSVVKSFARPDLHIQFIACEDDDLTTLAEMRELYEDLATTNKTFTVFAGAGHLAAPAKDPHLYETALFGRGS